MWAGHEHGGPAQSAAAKLREALVCLAERQRLDCHP
jgi:hypothetical protein